MINRVVVAGKILEGPTVDSSAQRATLVLGVEHPRWDGPERSRCRIEVVIPGPRRVQILRQYVQAGDDLLVHGHMEEGERLPRVVMERFTFMMKGITTRYLDQEAYAGARGAQQAA